MFIKDAFDWFLNWFIKHDHEYATTDPLGEDSEGLTDDPSPVDIEESPEKPQPEIETDIVFDEAANLVSIAEGGWCNVKGDKGGETIFGVARNYHPEWSGWSTVDEFAEQYGRGTAEFKDRVNNHLELKEKARNLFRAKFWMPINCDKMPREIAIITFDMAVNSGIGNAAKTLQKTVTSLGTKLSVDGVVGPLTLGGIDQEYVENKDLFIQQFLKYRYNFYHSIITRRPSQKKFWRGWVNRLRHLAETFNIDTDFLRY